MKAVTQPPSICATGDGPPRGLCRLARRAGALPARVAAAADVMCPNVLELGVMTGTSRTPAEVLAAARQLVAVGPGSCS